MNETSSHSKTEDDFYQQAYNEIQTGELYSPTWARALALAEGDKVKAESAYLRLRVQHLVHQYSVTSTGTPHKTEYKSKRRIPVIVTATAVIVSGWLLSPYVLILIDSLSFLLQSHKLTDSNGVAQIANSGKTTQSSTSDNNPQNAVSATVKPESSVARVLLEGGYVDNGNGTVTDPLTNLTWMRCSVGMQWTGITCTGEGVVLTWTDALRTAKSYNFAGHSDWRVPTVDELDALVQCPGGRRPSVRPGGLYVGDTSGGCRGEFVDTPKINIIAFPNTQADRFWSSSQYTGYSNGAWLVSFVHGDVLDYGKDTRWSVRLVRDGQ